MARLNSLEQMIGLYEAKGGLAYGEDVTQMDHALQCAWLAQTKGCSTDLIVSALLHDVGHLFEDEAQVASFAHDDHHEIKGADALSDLFGEAVTVPIALHVAAKRYLCWNEPDYFSRLSAASQASLQQQGGPFETLQALAFERLAYFEEALLLRRFDDAGKGPDPVNVQFSDYIPIMHELILQHSVSVGG